MRLLGREMGSRIARKHLQHQPVLAHHLVQQLIGGRLIWLITADNLSQPRQNGVRKRRAAANVKRSPLLEQFPQPLGVPLLPHRPIHIPPLARHHRKLLRVMVELHGRIRPRKGHTNPQLPLSHQRF